MTGNVSDLRLRSHTYSLTASLPASSTCSEQMATRKREADALPAPDSLELDKFTTKLKEEGGRDLVAKVALAIAHLGGLTATDLQSLSVTVPAFSKARWDKVALKFGLDVSRDIYQLGAFSVPCLSQRSDEKLGPVARCLPRVRFA